MNRRKIALLTIVFIAILAFVGTVWAIATIIQTFTYSVGTGLSATTTLPLGTIVPEISSSKIFDDVVASNDYAGIITIAFEEPTTTWQNVFDSFTLAIYSSDGVSGTVTGSPIYTIDITSATSCSFTVSTNEEFDYETTWTVLPTAVNGTTLEISIS